MLTAHQALMIRRHLPEVESVHVSTDRDDAARIYYRQLYLSDSTQIVLFGETETRARRYHCRDDYSNKADLLPIEPDLRRRLVLVFGALHFGDDS